MPGREDAAKYRGSFLACAGKEVHAVLAAARRRRARAAVVSDAARLGAAMTAMAAGLVPLGTDLEAFGDEAAVVAEGPEDMATQKP